MKCTVLKQDMHGHESFDIEHHVENMVFVPIVLKARYQKGFWLRRAEKAKVGASMFSSLFPTAKEDVWDSAVLEASSSDLCGFCRTPKGSKRSVGLDLQKVGLAKHLQARARLQDVSSSP